MRRSARATKIPLLRRSTSRNFAWIALCGMLLCGATSTGSLSPAATVAARCTISAPAAFAFGAYDPLVANRTTSLDVAANAISVACTKGAPGVNIALNNGSHYTTTRNLSVGTDLLAYQLYTTPARTTVWDAANVVSYTSTSMAASALPVYGRIPAGQDAVVNANYSDTIVATVNF